METDALQVGTGIWHIKHGYADSKTAAAVFFFEAAKLAKAAGLTSAQTSRLTNMAFGRTSKPEKTAAGACLVTLAQHCNTVGIELGDAGLSELRRMAMTNEVGRTLGNIQEVAEVLCDE